MKLSWRLCLLVVLAVRPLGAAAAPAPLSLADALRLAQRENRSVQSREELSRAGGDRVRRAESALRPRISLEAMGKDGPPSAPGFGFSGLANTTLTHNGGADVVLSQLLYDAGRTRHRILAARHAVDALRADGEVRRATVALEVIRAYADALQARRFLAVLEGTLTARRTSVRLAEARFKAGFVSRVDVDLAKIGVAEVQQAIAEAGGAYEEAMADLNVALGVPVKTAHELEEPPQNEGLPGQNAPSASRKRPELRSLRAQLAAAEETVKGVRAEHGPTLRAIASGGWVNVTPANADANHTYAVGLGVTVPIYTGGAIEADVDEARHRQAALQKLLEEAELEVAADVMRARSRLAALQASRPAAAGQLRSAQDFATLARKRYAAGLTGILEVEQAQARALEAEAGLVRLRYRILAARAELRWALGELP